LKFFDKILSLTTNSDTSPDVKPGEIKNILISQAEKTTPDFVFLAYKNNCYIFQRTRKINSLTVYETFHIIFSLKDKNFACSVASRLNTNYIFINSYNAGLINPHIDLVVLKKGKGVIRIEEAYYFHNGKVKTTTKIVEQIFKDFKQYGLPFIDKQFERLKKNKIIKSGLAYLDSLNLDKKDLREQIEKQLTQERGMISSIIHPAYTGLKQHLQNIKGQTREDRKTLPRLSFDLIESYWSND
jgi:hypothetical protein